MEELKIEELKKQKSKTSTNKLVCCINQTSRGIFPAKVFAAKTRGSYNTHYLTWILEPETMLIFSNSKFVKIVTQDRKEWDSMAVGELPELRWGSYRCGVEIAVWLSNTLAYGLPPEGIIWSKKKTQVHVQSFRDDVISGLEIVKRLRKPVVAERRTDDFIAYDPNKPREIIHDALEYSNSAKINWSPKERSKAIEPYGKLSAGMRSIVRAVQELSKQREE